MPAPLKLYWCTTPDHDEDWFIVARSARQAARLHETEEGYARGDAHAQLVVRLPEALQKKVEPGWPVHDTIVACGGVFEEDPADDERTLGQQLMGQGGRAVRFGGRVYREGDIWANGVLRTMPTPSTKH